MAARLRGKPVFCELEPAGQLASEIQVGAEDADQHQGGAGDFAPGPTGARVGAVLGRRGFEGQVLNHAVVGLGCEVTYGDHDDGGDDGDEQAEILEVQVVDDPEEGTAGIAALEARKPESDGRVDSHPEEAERKADQHSPERALGIHPLEE